MYPLRAYVPRLSAPQSRLLLLPPPTSAWAVGVPAAVVLLEDTLLLAVQPSLLYVDVAVELLPFRLCMIPVPPMKEPDV